MRALVVICVLLSGCASVTKNLQEIDSLKNLQELNISRASIIPSDNLTNVKHDHLSGMEDGATIGCTIGFCLGAGVGIIGCIPAGPAYELCVYLSGGVLCGAGGAVGGTVGGLADLVNYMISDEQEQEYNMLAEALITLEASQNLAPLVYKKSLESLSHVTSQEEKSSTTADAEWTLRITLDEFATDGSDSNTPYSLQLSASIEIISPDNNIPVFNKKYLAKSSLQKTTAEWRTKDDVSVRSTLDDLLANLATEISNDLKPIRLSLGRPTEDYKVHVQSVSTEIKTEPAVLENSQGQSTVNQEAYNPDQNNIFDPTTGRNWIIIDSNPVDLDTANSLCNSLEVGDKKKYKVPSLHDFEGLWKKYSNDERISIFKKREYCTDGKNNFTRSVYVQTFSFSNGRAGLPSQLNAAYLTCISK